ncbi:hypothetical protein H6P81_007667 [Aristolochia fimbriata]|uniref:Uncharacterized protein n=1 Tax=Aristolochia fimbriata TaxID=158543 RepID=A0AAV7F146_ARIFI|nr:hypothetical protein H6P81_007667 [Aristolochia fimbriata]
MLLIHLDVETQFDDNKSKQFCPACCPITSKQCLSLFLVCYVHDFMEWELIHSTHSYVWDGGGTLEDKNVMAFCLTLACVSMKKSVSPRISNIIQFNSALDLVS